ncbi:NUDIX domain-containing protein [Streptomyces sp. NPDC085596]|uniref:NUDIX hydrolase n=1 Tax=Streptomyces sp. NPDC085596 TaxID=3365731 RepID=UPI0037D5FE11
MSTFAPGSAHLTCRALVIDRERRVLRVRDPAGSLPVAPGARAGTGDRTLLGAALRAVTERTRLAPGDLCLTPELLTTPVHVEAVGPAHYEFTFALYLARDLSEPLPDVDWLPLDQLNSAGLRAKSSAAALDGRPAPVNASALIHDGEGRYLLHLRDHIPGIWEPGAFALLGGGREPGDRTLEDTLRRELAEEVPGLDPADLKPYTVEEATGAEGLCVPVQVFSGRWTGDPDGVGLAEGVLLRWFRPDMLHRLRLAPGTRELLLRHAARPAVRTPAIPRPAKAPDAGGTELNIVGVHLYAEDDDGRVLLGLRHPDAVFAGSTWHFLAGHCERESAVACLVREAHEEAGLLIDPGDVELAHVVHVLHGPSARPRVQLVFRARRWQGTPWLREPDKCLDWRWWDPDRLPEPLVPYARTAIDGIRTGRAYSEMGWCPA